MKFVDVRYCNVMEDLILSTNQQKILKKHKRKIQNRYNVEILMPDVAHSSSTDLIFASISGEKANIEKVKTVISRIIKMNERTKSEMGDVIVVTLSDSEEEELPTSVDFKGNSVYIIETSLTETAPKIETEILPVPSSNSLEDSVCIVELPTSVDFKDNSVCIIETSLSETAPKIETEILPVPSSNSLEDSVSIVEASYICENTQESSRNIVNKKRKARKQEALTDHRQNDHQKVRPKTVLHSSRAEDSEICEVSSTTDEPVLKKAKFLEEPDCMQREPSKISSPAPDFLPLFLPSKPNYQKNNAPNKRKLPGSSVSSAVAVNNDDEIVVLDESHIERPLAPPRRLRPVVIDGSNVARAHGMTTKSFSGKGIQICVEYFLNRGHTQVTAFIPQFRRHADHWKTIPTTDTKILEDLAEKQHVVFTPSRRVNGRRIASYDDRFVVELAAQNGGVIVSNDNFHDLVEESESFREAIEERLLQFLFVGDVFMVPKDPLGRNGPTLEEYLSFSPEISSNT